jgi:brefeldin A-inhibited guanine nucleotide-exchange protein
MFQKLIENLSKTASQAVMILPLHQQQYEERVAKAGLNGSAADWQARGTLPPPLSTAHMATLSENTDNEIPKEYIIKRQALECLVETLRSLVNWSQQGIADVTGKPEADVRASEDFRESLERSGHDSSSKVANGDTPIVPRAMPYSNSTSNPNVGSSF